MDTKSFNSLEGSFEAHKILIGVTLEAVQMPMADAPALTLVFTQGLGTISNIYSEGIGEDFDPDLYLNERVRNVELLSDRVRVLFENGASFDNGAF